MPVKATRISISQDQLEDLHARLLRVHWPSAMSGYGWDEGMDNRYLRHFVDYWLNDYNWREREAYLNAFDHHVAEIDNTEVHFIFAKGEKPNSIPLLLLHGWPSSFVQMIDFIPMLTRSQDDRSPTFDVVAASLPGYPLARLPDQPGMNFPRMASILTRLMVDELGYDRFAGRGSDQGGLVLQQIGLASPDRLIGLHRSGITPFAHSPLQELSEEEMNYQSKVSGWLQQETAYAQLQSLRPETLTPALADSPVALASWFLEKFQRWGDCRNGIDAQFGRARLADNLSLHWFAGSAVSSTRLYLEARRAPGLMGRVSVPTAIVMPLHDGVTVPAPRAWCERTYNVVRFTLMEEGGHFPEWENPNFLANDVREFFQSLTS